MNDAINSFYKCVSNNLLGSERNKFRNVCYYLLEKYYVSHVCAFNLNELIDYFKDSFVVLQILNYCAYNKEGDLYYINFDSIYKIEKYLNSSFNLL